MCDGDYSNEVVQTSLVLIRETTAMQKDRSQRRRRRRSERCSRHERWGCKFDRVLAITTILLCSQKLFICTSLPSSLPTTYQLGQLCTHFWLKMCVFLFMLLSAATTMVLLKMMLRMSRLWSASMSHPIRPLRKNLCNKKAIPSGLVSTWDANKRIHKHFKNLLCSQGTFMRCLPIHNIFTVA